jgi:hypothetical protein
MKISDILTIRKIRRGSIIMKIEKTEKKKLNKKVVLVAVIILIIIVAAVLLFTVFGKKSNEKDLEASLTDMGKNFYENFYYEQIGSSADERTSLLSKFTTIGIKIDLENLGRYNDGEFKDEISNFKNSLTGKACDQTNTKVVIYPKSPYGKTDYKVEAELDCGFDSK